MKRIKYQFLSAEINHGTEEKPLLQQVLLEKSMTWSEQNEKIAEKEAWNGTYTIEDDGLPEPEAQLTQEQRIAELEEALAMVLSGETE